MPEIDRSILIAGLNFAPEPSGNAPYTTRLASQLRALGRDVQVITGYPHYPEWKPYEGYVGWSRKEILNGVQVRRLAHYIPRRPRALPRLLMEVSFGVRVAFTSWGSPSVLVLVSPALLATGLAVLRARVLRQKAPVVVWVQDIYSLGLAETGGAGEIVTAVMKRIERAIFGAADGLVVIHERFRDRLSDELGVDPAKISVIRNWTHLEPYALENRQQSRASFGWGPEDVIVLHAGNMGVKQGLGNVINAARIAERTGSHVRFVLLGDGNQRALLEDMAQGLSNVQFINPLPGDRFQEALACADLLLVNELAGVREMSVPSKLTSYFSSGVPVIAATDEDSISAQELRVADAGIRVEPGEPKMLVAAAENLTSDVERCERYAANGLSFMVSTLSEAAAVAQYDRYLVHLAGEAPMGK